MPDIVSGKIWVDGEKGVTAAKMNSEFTGAVIQPSFVGSKPSASSIAATDQLLVLQTSGAYAKAPFSTVSSSVAGLLPPAGVGQAGMMNALDGFAGSYVGGDNACHSPAFVSKTAAYTLVTADVGKYILCSGGSWTLTLPAPASGLWYRLRNDMGIIAGSTTGTITLTPNGGTIDGLASMPLLPQQECKIFCDGANWRTFGRQREVILGTLDITSAVANATILLPLGYRFFLLDFKAIAGSSDQQPFEMFFSPDGGTTFRTDTLYYSSMLYNSSASTPAAVVQASVTYAYLGIVGNVMGGDLEVKVYPGSSNTRPSWLSKSGGYYSSSGYAQNASLIGFYSGSPTVPMNAARFAPVSGNIANMFLTVKGVV